MRRSSLSVMGILVMGVVTGATSVVRAEGPGGTLRFTINPAASKMTARVAEPMAMIRGSAEGTFTILKGEVKGAPTAVADTAHVSLVVDAASYKTTSEARDRDVRENALEAQKFPTITFESTGVADVARKSDRAGSLRVLGQLTLHGVTKTISVPVAVGLDDQGRLVADGTYVFKFKEYGVKRPSKMMGLMTTGDEAEIRFHVVADPA